MPLAKGAVKPRGRCTPFFSPEDADLASWKWHYTNQGYAQWATKRKGKMIHRNAHRIVMERILGRDTQGSEWVDHINRNRLDNRRENLRVVSPLVNGQNKACANDGVTWFKPSGKWRARIMFRYREIHIGMFDEKADALEAVRLKREEIAKELVAL